jgi:uncharacterized protein
MRLLAGGPVADNPTVPDADRAGTPALGRVAVAVMARRPALGKVKTRLAASVGVDAALVTYRGLLAGTLAAVDELDRGTFSSRLDRFLALEPDEAPPAGETHFTGWRDLFQREGGLGDRLSGVFADLFDRGYDAVVIVGSDSPSLPVAYLDEAIRLLATSGGGGPGLVFGPAADGGYYLVGSTASLWRSSCGALEDLLAATPMGTPVALAFSLERARGAGIRPAVLPLWVDVDVVRDLPLAARLRTGSPEPERGAPLTNLREVYLHVTDRCEGHCAHCYGRYSVSDGRAAELSTTAWLDVIAQAVALGTKGFVLIGGDPFLRDDLPVLIDEITGRHQARARLFFNRSLTAGAVGDLVRAGRGRLTPLLSLEGSIEVNDRLRGAGNHDEALATARLLVAAGLRPVVNTVLLRPVLAGLPDLLEEMAATGLDRLHLILPHQRGGLAGLPDLVPTGREMQESLEEVIPLAARLAVAIDNLSAWKARFATGRDLCTAGCSLLTVGPAGLVYACPITNGDPLFVAGDLTRDDLATVWRSSPGLRLLRHSHARDRDACAGCPQVDVCGGECWVQAHYAAQMRGEPAGFLAPFPYCDLVRPQLEALAAAGFAVGNGARRTETLQPFACI